MKFGIFVPWIDDVSRPSGLPICILFDEHLESSTCLMVADFDKSLHQSSAEELLVLHVLQALIRASMSLVLKRCSG